MMIETQCERAQELPPCTLTEVKRSISEGMEVTYRLLALPLEGQHLIAELWRGGEQSVAYLGTGERARAIFALLVRGDVTPCALREVVEDLQKSDTVLPFFGDEFAK